MKQSPHTEHSRDYAMWKEIFFDICVNILAYSVWPSAHVFFYYYNPATSCEPYSYTYNLVKETAVSILNVILISHGQFRYQWDW